MGRSDFQPRVSLLVPVVRLVVSIGKGTVPHSPFILCHLCVGVWRLWETSAGLAERTEACLCVGLMSGRTSGIRGNQIHLSIGKRRTKNAESERIITKLNRLSLLWDTNSVFKWSMMWKQMELILCNCWNHCVRTSDYCKLDQACCCVSEWWQLTCFTLIYFSNHEALMWC